MTEEFKPCPFCGGKAEQLFYKHPEFDGDSRGIGCTKCTCSITGYVGSLKIQIEKWNTRHQASEADVEKIKQEYFEAGRKAYWHYEIANWFYEDLEHYEQCKIGAAKPNKSPDERLAEYALEQSQLEGGKK